MASALFEVQGAASLKATHCPIQPPQGGQFDNLLSPHELARASTLSSCLRSSLMSFIKKPLITVCVASLAYASPFALAADWPAFLGPARDGKSSESGLLDRWDTEGPAELWRVEGGVGMAGIAIADGVAVTLFQDDSQQFAIALELATGKTIWKTELGAAYENQMGNGARATPAIDGDITYVFTGDGLLVAINLKDGKELWRHAVLEELDGAEADYGMASSPLIVGDRVIVTAGTEQGLIVAYHKQSGKREWTAGSDRAGYSSPVLRRLGTGDQATEQLVVFSASAVRGFDPNDGSELWEFGFETPYDCNIAVPIELEGDLLISSGENHGSVRLKLEQTAEGWSVSETWNSTGPRSVLRSEWQTVLEIDGYLYGFDNVGSAGPTTHLTCIDAKTGERVWREERFGKGNAIAADGKMIATTMDGDLVLIRVTPDGYEELSRARLHNGTRQAPSLSNGILIVRDDAEIMAFRVGQ